MKRTLLSLSLLFAAVVSLSANVQKVKVVAADDGMPLPFSYVYINGKAFGSADKNAETFIPQSLIKDGDFISASYVGYNNTSVEYIDPQEVYVIEMGRSTIQAIKIFTQQETRKRFREIKHRAPMARASDFKLEFIFDVNGEKFCSGDFYHFFNSQLDEAIRRKYPVDVSLINMDDPDKETTQFFGEEPTKEEFSNSHNRLYVEVPEEMEAVLADPEKKEFVKKKMIPIIQDVFYTASRGVVTLPDYIAFCGIRIQLLGEKQAKREFLLSRQDNGRTFDKVVSSIVLVEVDTLIHDVKSARMNITKRDGRLELTAKYGVSSYFRYPYVVEATYFMNDGNQYAMVLYNTRTTYADKPHVFRRRNSVDNWDTDNELLDGQTSWLRTWGDIPLDEDEAGQQKKQSVHEIQGNDFPTILYKQLVEELQVAPMSYLLFRERLETIAMVNAVWH